MSKKRLSPVARKILEFIDGNRELSREKKDIFQVADPLLYTTTDDVLDMHEALKELAINTAQSLHLIHSEKDVDDAADALVSEWRGT